MPLTARRDSRRKRPIRWVLRPALALIAAVAVLLLVQGPILRRFVLPRVEDALGAVLGLDVTLRDAFLDPRGHAVLIFFEARGRTPRSGIRAAAFERVDVSFSPLKLLRGRDDWLEKVRIERPRLELDLRHEPMLPAVGGPASEAQSRSPGPLLPALELVDASLHLLNKADVLHLHGVNASFEGRRIRLSVASAEGNWSPPRVQALKFPLEAEVVLDGPIEPWTEVRLARLALAGREYAKDVRADLSDPDSVKLAGDLPGWGATLTAGSISGGLIDLDFRADGGDLRGIVSLFTDWPCPEGRGTGDFRLILPIGREGDWRVAASLEISRVSWPEQSLTADIVQADVRRGGKDLILEGDVIAIGLEWHGMPPVDLTGRFRRWGGAPGAPGFQLALDDVVLRRGEAEAAFSGLFHEEDLRVENGAIGVSRLLLAELARLGVLPERFAAWAGEVALEVFFQGTAGDPSSFAGAGGFRATGMTSGGGEPETDLAAAVRLAACQLRVEDGALRRCEDEVRFDLGAGMDLPPTSFAASFERLRGSVMGAAFETVEPPVVEVGAAGFRVEPCSFRAVGGMVDVLADGSAAEGVTAMVRASSVDLSFLAGALPGLEPRGTLTLDAAFDSAAADRRRGPFLEAEARVLHGSLLLAGERIRDVDVSSRIAITSDALEIHDLRLSRGGDRASVTASIPVVWNPLPVPADGEPFDAKLSLDIADIGAVPHLAAGFRELGGRVVVNGAARGRVPGGAIETWNDMDLFALVSVLGGTIKRYEDFPPITGVDAELRLERGRISVERLTGNVHDASFTVSGDVDAWLPWQPGGPGIRGVDLRLVSRSALLVRRTDLRVRGDLDLRWHGPWESSRLEGDVNIHRAYYLDDVSLTPSRGARLPLRLFSFRDAPLDALRFDVKVKSDRGITVRNNLVSTRASANLVLGGTGLEPVLTGTVSTDEGTVRFADSALKLRNSFVELVPEDPLNPRLHIVIGETIRGYAVTVAVTGTLDGPEVLLDSAPPLEREKVLVLIATGLTIEEIEERGVSRVAAVKAAKYVGFRIARYFSRGDPTERTFLDRFSLETESARSAQLEDPIRVEYRLIERLIRENDELFLQGERDAYGDYNFNLGVRFELD